MVFNFPSLAVSCIYFFDLEEKLFSEHIMIGISNLDLHKWFLWVAKQSQYPYLHILAIIWTKEALYAMCQHAFAIWWLYSTNVRGHLFCYNSSTLENICWCYEGLNDRHIIPTLLQGVPKKTGILGKMPITDLGRGLEIKVGYKSMYRATGF